MFEEIYQQYIGTKANLTKLIILLSCLVLTILYGVFVTKNDPTHFMVIEHVVSGDLTVKKNPGHFIKGINRVYSWEWSRPIWFSPFDEEGREIDESINAQYRDGAKGSVSGVMVYSFGYNAPDSFFTNLQQSMRTQDNFESRMVRPMMQESIPISASQMTSEESYTVAKKDFGFYCLDQLEYGVYLTEVTRDSIKDFTGETIVADKPTIKRNKEGKPLRSKERSLKNLNIEVVVFSLYEPTYAPEVDTMIVQKRQASMNKVISLAATKLARREAYKATIEGNVNVLTEKYSQMAKNAIVIKAAETLKDTTRIVSETDLSVARIRKTIAEMKKQIGELEGRIEYNKRSLLMQADRQLVDRLEAYKNAQVLMAGAFLTDGRIMPDILFGNSGKGGSSFTQSAIELNQSLQLIDQLKVDKGQ